MRLICKPHRELVDKAEFKEQMIAMLSQNDETEDVVLVDNNRKNTARAGAPFLCDHLQRMFRSTLTYPSME